MIVLAIDPGQTESAWLYYNGTQAIYDFGKEPNETLLPAVESLSGRHLVIEMVESMGMPVGREVFETVYWIGRFAQAAQPVEHTLITRGAVKLNLCGSKRA